MQGQKQRRFTMECIHNGQRGFGVPWKVTFCLPSTVDLRRCTEGHCTVSPRRRPRLSLARFTWSGIRRATAPMAASLRNQVSRSNPACNHDLEGEILEIVETNEGWFGFVAGNIIWLRRHETR